MSSVQSIERAFALLNALSSGAAGVTELSERVALPKSTVSRLLSTLEAVGAVVQVEAGGRYRIGEAMIDLATAALPGRTLVAAARPQLLALARLTGEATGISVPDGTEMFYLDQVNPDGELRVRDWTGARIAQHAVPSGQVVLAAATPETIDRYLSRDLESFTVSTITDANVLKQRLTEVRTLGYAWAVEEFADGLSSIAAPIRDRRGTVIAALHIYGPTSRLPGERDVHELGNLVCESAAQIWID
jgi:IclR family KDG regulon transcriptional repressor